MQTRTIFVTRTKKSNYFYNILKIILFLQFYPNIMAKLYHCRQLPQAIIHLTILIPGYFFLFLMLPLLFPSIKHISIIYRRMWTFLSNFGSWWHVLLQFHTLWCLNHGFFVLSAILIDCCYHFLCRFNIYNNDISWYQNRMKRNHNLCTRNHRATSLPYSIT